MQRSHRVDLSIVVPVYGCAATLDELHRRLNATLTDLVERFEIVFVDDCDPSNSWPKLMELAAADPNVVAVRTCRNVGQPLAIAVGLQHCCGDRAVVMDCDLQDPPEAVAALWARAHAGFDIVLAKRMGEHQPKGRDIANRLYIALLNFVIGQRYARELGSFTLASRPAIERFLSQPQRGGPYPLILLRLGLPSSIIEVERQPRPFGRSSFSMLGLVSYGLAGLVFATASGLLPQYDLAALVERRIDSAERRSS